VILMAVAFVLGVAGASWSTSSVRWVVNKDGIEGTGGVLPWKRANFYYTFDQIFDVYWRRPKIAFLGWLFNVGTIGFRTASGVADALEQNLMARPQRFHELGLEYTGQANQAQVDHSSDSANGSVADELERLAKLRDQGNISEEEYEKLKAKALSE
jgi:hypothetical protein